MGIMSVYLYTAIGIILVIFMLGQVAQRKSVVYEKNQVIAVRTANRTIKMSPNAACVLLLDIKERCVKLNRVCEKYETAIENAISRLSRFIKSGGRLYNVNLIDKAMQDRITPYEHRQQYSDALLVDLEDDDKDLFNHLLNHIDIAVEMLRSHVYDENHVLDIVELERLLLEMEKDLTRNGRFVDSVGFELRSEIRPVSAERPLSRITGPMEAFDSKPSAWPTKLMGEHPDGRHLVERGLQQQSDHPTLTHTKYNISVY